VYFSLVTKCFLASYLAVNKIASLATKLLHWVPEREKQIKVDFKAQFKITPQVCGWSRGQKPPPTHPHTGSREKGVKGIHKERYGQLQG